MELLEVAEIKRSWGEIAQYVLHFMEGQYQNKDTYARGLVKAAHLPGINEPQKSNSSYPGGSFT